MSHLVFVYGTLKKGFHNHRLLEHDGVAFCGEATTVSGSYRMFCTGSFPVVFRVRKYRIANKEQCGRVTGEVYLVDDKIAGGLDRLEDEGYMYIKKKVRIRFADRDQRTSALIYVGKHQFWRRHRSLRRLDPVDGLFKWSYPHQRQGYAT